MSTLRQDPTTRQWAILATRRGDRPHRDVVVPRPQLPEFDPSCGIETTTGPLGQGIANAAGMAVAEAFLSAWLGPEIVDHHTWAFVGDGCLQEGIGQEIISLAGNLRLGKLTFLFDDNRMTDDGDIAIAAGELPAAHGDPADRLHVATAMHRGLTLLTADDVLLQWRMRGYRAQDATE